jgi:hypothetical protein
MWNGWDAKQHCKVHAQAIDDFALLHCPFHDHDEKSTMTDQVRNPA